MATRILLSAVALLLAINAAMSLSRKHDQPDQKEQVSYRLYRDIKAGDWFFPAGTMVSVVADRGTSLVVRYRSPHNRDYDMTVDFPVHRLELVPYSISVEPPPPPVMGKTQCQSSD